MIPVNRKLGKFEIIRKLARGGMADVYLGQDDTGRTIALKLIEHSPDADTIAAIEAERRGAALQSRLSALDARVVEIYDTGDIDEYFFLAMEYIEGEDLAEVIRRGPLPAPRAAEIAVSICETLEHAHNLHTEIDGKDYQGIIHGDVKPRNIRIEPDGRVRVLDFGIAKALSLSRRLTVNEFGSIQYASPERLDTGEVDFMSDLWSAGVVLYEMVTGLQPYQASTTERLERMIQSRIPPPPAPEPCPEPLRQILIKAMAPDPADRYQSADALAEDLRHFRLGMPVRIEPPDHESTRRTARPAASDTEATRRTTRPAPPPPPGEHPITGQPYVPIFAQRRFGRAVWRVFAGLLIVAAIYIGYWFASSYFLYDHGQKLENAIRTENLTDPDQIWQQWTELSQGRPSSVFLYGPRRAVKEKLLSAADAVIAHYRNSDVPAVALKDWTRAHSLLAKALTVEPGDDAVRGKLRLTEAQMALDTPRWTLATMHDAEEKFQQAQQLMPKSPDPQIGLARLYVYGLKDIEKADAALEQARKHGYEIGNRDKNLLADGYRQRADRLFYDTRNIRALPQEKDQVKKAADDYKRSLDLYQQIAPYGNAATMIARVQSSLESVQYRLQQLEESGTGWR